MLRTTRKRLGLVALGVVGAMALAACGGSGGSTVSQNSAGGYGSIPTESGTPKSGGVVSIAEFPSAGPNWILPIIDGTHSSVYTAYQFQNLMFRPLYWATTGASPTVDYSKSLAAAPVFSNDNKTVTININKGYKWSDGKPVTASDVVFEIDMTKAAVKENASNLAGYTQGLYPDDITSATALNDSTLQVQLNQSFNPSWELLEEVVAFYTPLPSQDWNIAADGGPHLDFTNPANAKAIYDYLYKQSSSLSTYATNPLWQIVDGPFKIKTYNANTNATNLVANPAYTGADKPKISELDELSYTSTDAEWNDILSGKLDVGAVDPTDLPQLNSVAKKGYAYYGLPSTGFEYMYFNFKDTTGDFDKVISQLYVRQALAHLQDEDAVIKGAFKGAAVAQYSTIGPLPQSQYSTSANTKVVYPYSTSDAKDLLTQHGWAVVNGVETCQKAGTGAGQCGAGIPAGTTLAFPFLYDQEKPAVTQQAEAFASAAKQIGVNVTLKPYTFNNLLATANDPSSPSTENQWAMADFGGFTGFLYPTANTIFNTTGSYNEGGYSDPTADKLINASVYGNDPNALVNESNYLGKNLPAIFQPSQDIIYAWKKTLQGPANSFANLTQYYLTPEDWYFTS